MMPACARGGTALRHSEFDRTEKIRQKMSLRQQLLRGRLREQRETGTTFPFMCKLCDVRCNTASVMQQHYTGRKHRTAVFVRHMQETATHDAARFGLLDPLLRQAFVEQQFAPKPCADRPAHRDNQFEAQRFMSLDAWLGCNPVAQAQIDARLREEQRDHSDERSAHMGQVVDALGGSGSGSDSGNKNYNG